MDFKLVSPFQPTGDPEVCRCYGNYGASQP